MMKVSELEGAALDLWVARALGLRAIPGEPDGFFYWKEGIYDASGWFAPSTDWAQAGPIIQREKIDWISDGIGWKAGFNADLDSNGYGSSLVQWIAFEHEQVGPTPLVAAMRAYVARKVGDTVPDAPAIPRHVINAGDFELDGKACKVEFGALDKPCIEYSLDAGATWIKSPNNTVPFSPGGGPVMVRGG